MKNTFADATADMTTLLRVLDLVAQMENHTSLRIAPDHFLSDDGSYGYHCSVTTKDRIFTGYSRDLKTALKRLEAKLTKHQDEKRK